MIYPSPSNMIALSASAPKRGDAGGSLLLLCGVYGGAHLLISND